MPLFPKHVFLCASASRGKHPRGCCLGKGAAAIHDELELLLTQRGLAGKILIDSVDCLAQCTRGGILGVYPDAVWYGYASVDDILEILESHLVGDVPVERLRLSPETIDSELCLHSADRLRRSQEQTG